MIKDKVARSASKIKLVNLPCGAVTANKTKLSVSYLN